MCKVKGFSSPLFLGFNFHFGVSLTFFQGFCFLILLYFASNFYYFQMFSVNFLNIYFELFVLSFLGFSFFEAWINIQSFKITFLRIRSLFLSLKQACLILSFLSVFHWCFNIQLHAVVFVKPTSNFCFQFIWSFVARFPFLKHSFPNFL